MSDDIDRAALEQSLAEAQRHVIGGEHHVARQRTIVAGLERDGQVEAAANAARLLKQFEEVLSLHVADRDRLRKKLGLA